MTTMTTTVSRDGGWHMSWGAIFGGTIITLGLWLVLHTLGLAAGLTAIDPGDQGSLRGIGIGTGIWSVIAPLIALFVGGFVAARTAGLVDRMTGAIHGAVVWGLTIVLGAVLLMMALTGIVRAGASAASTGVSAMTGASINLQALGLDSQELLAPVNQRLQQQGLPPVTAQQLEAATRDALHRAVQTGQVDQRLVVNALAQNTAMTQEEARAVATQLETQVNQRASELRQSALTIADRAGKAMWGITIALLLGLLSAVAGATVGSSRRARVVVEDQPPPSPATRHVPVQTHG